jgi:hypothetical protein
MPQEPFKGLVKTAATLGISEFWACVAVSMCMTGVLVVFSFIVCLPIKSLTVHVRSVADVPNSSELWLQPFWDWLVKDLGHFTASAAFPGIMSLVYYYAGCMPWFILDLVDFECLRKYKIRGEERPLGTYADWVKTLEYTFGNFAAFIAPGVAWQM